MRRPDFPGLFALFAVVTLGLTIAEKLFNLAVPTPVLLAAVSLCMAAMLGINFALGTGDRTAPSGASKDVAKEAVPPV